MEKNFLLADFKFALLNLAKSALQFHEKLNGDCPISVSSKMHIDKLSLLVAEMTNVEANNVISRNIKKIKDEEVEVSAEPFADDSNFPPTFSLKYPQPSFCVVPMEEEEATSCNISSTTNVEHIYSRTEVNDPDLLPTATGSQKHRRLPCPVCRVPKSVHFMNRHLSAMHRITQPIVLEQSSSKSVKDILEHAINSNAAQKFIKWQDRYVRCKLCRKVFRSPEYNRHMRQKHRSFGCRFRCSVCFDGFESERACKLHIHRSKHFAKVVVKNELPTEDSVGISFL